MFEENRLSNKYIVRKLTEDDIGVIYDLSIDNKVYYEYHPPVVTNDSIIEDMNALPPNKEMADKYYVGFFGEKNNELVAIMDLILGYPKNDTAFIGLFMMDIRVQGKGVGSEIITECISYLKEKGFEKVRLGVDKGNPQSFHFWTKNQFQVDESCKGKYIVMERKL